ncbi:MAG: hypothetical protein DRO09_00155 [Thermoprotei archaeon]|nr:MAG: hypothetical protein DRO09_00155 [Thermoprotei archaeon]
MEIGRAVTRSIDVAYGVIVSGHIASGQIGSAHIADGAILSGHIASGQIGATHIADGAILSGHIASGQIGAAHVASGALTFSNLKGVASFVSSADTTLTLSHNLGVTPSLYGVTPHGNATYYVTTVNASQLVVTTTVSGVGALLWVVA